MVTEVPVDRTRLRSYLLFNRSVYDDCDQGVPAVPEQRRELRRACRARQGRARLQALQADGSRLAGAGQGAGLARRHDAAVSPPGGVVHSPSLRAKRSNPASFAAARKLDCFVAALL